MQFFNEQPTTSNQQPKSGFTLVELSIVVVIIGLLIVGALAGRSLYHHAQLQAVITEMKGHASIIKAFREKYGALPGDMADAWSLFNTTCDCGGNASAAATDCNGNGNGAIRSLEVGRVWRHLWCAGMIAEPFPATGATSSNSSKAMCGKTTSQACPNGILLSSRYSGTFGKDKAWLLEHTQEVTTIDTGSTIDRIHGNAGNYLILAGHDNTVNTEVGGGLLTGDAIIIDEKVDDGMPGAGQMLAVIGYNAPYTMTGTCLAGGSTAAAGYNLPSAAYNLNENTADKCRPLFNIEYY